MAHLPIHRRFAMIYLLTCFPSIFRSYVEHVDFPEGSTPDLSLRCWELFCLEHGIQPDGQMPSDKTIGGRMTLRIYGGYTCGITVGDYVLSFVEMYMMCIYIYKYIAWFDI